MASTLVLYSLDKEVVFFKKDIKVQEARPLDRGELLTCLYQGKTFHLAKAGVGGEQVTSTLEALVKKVNPRCIILAGYAGSADPNLKIGTVILPEKVITRENTIEEIPVDSVVSLPTGADYRTNITLRTVPGLCFKKDKKKVRAELGNNLAVDMESGFCAAWTREKGVPFAVVKAISDGFDTALPSAQFVTGFFEKKQQGGQLLKQMVLHPIQFRRLAGLNKGCIAAARSLGRILCEILAYNEESI
jgi:nucleoside phosphorylase